MLRLNLHSVSDSVLLWPSALLVVWIALQLVFLLSGMHPAATGFWWCLFRLFGVISSGVFFLFYWAWLSLAVGFRLD